MPPGSNEQERFSPRYLTIGQTVALYQLTDEPLNGETILAVLEPLTGTSFLGIATSDLISRIREGKPMHAEDLYLSFFGRQLQMINPLTDSPIQGDAIMALQSQTSQFVAIDRVLTHEKLREDELMLHEARWDDIYFEYDTEHEQKAFTHAALQWRFYKGGNYLHTLSLTRLSIQTGLQTKIYSHFSEGIHEHSFFVDQQRRPLPYLQPEQQDFLRCYRMLYISPRFSYDAARRK